MLFAAGTAASTVIGEIWAIRGQKSSVAAIFFVTLRKIFGRNISERLELTPRDEESRKAKTRKGKLKL